MSINFRMARPNDLPRIVEIYNQTISLKNVTADLKPVTVAEREQWFLAFSPDAYPLWVMSETTTREVVGWVGLEAFYGRAAYQQTAEISIYLDQNYRGQHLGSQAFDFVISQLPRLNIHNIVGFVFKQNPASLGLFKKQGFSQWGLLPQVAQIEGKYLDLVIVGKHFN